MTNNQKSRDLPLTSYFSNLQLEWLCYYIRMKVYKKDFAKNYSKICDGKKEKILGIANKNLLPCIFSSKEYLKKYLDQLIPEYGIPLFQYKDKEVENKMKKWDSYYYFSRGISVKFIDNDSLYVGVIDNNDKDAEVLEIYCQETKKLHYIHYSKVSRIFSEDFFNI